MPAMRARITELQNQITEKTKTAKDAAAKDEIVKMQRELDGLRRKLSTSTPVLKDLPSAHAPGCEYGSATKAGTTCTPDVDLVQISVRIPAPS